MTSLRTPPANIRSQIDELSARAASLEEQLLRSQRLATLGTLSMSVAHEFNNLLMTIINQADSALAIDRQETMRKALEKTLSCGETASTLIRNILGFAKAADSEPRCLRASQLMEDALGLLGRNPAKDGLTVERHYDESLEVKVSPVELTQVLLNLIINSRQAMAGGSGTLTLRVYCDKGRVALAVGDTGVGIQAENMGKIFEPFFTTKSGNSGDGTGLGLFLARKIVESHGGDISVVSRPGDGATFTVYLPQAE